MPTITREAVLIDRRQPMLRWSAVFAGGACSVGVWLVLELLGVGAGLYAHHAADSAGAMHAASLATRVWSLVAQVIALFIGGVVAGRFAQTYERKLAGLHGFVMWALTSLVGTWATVWVITMITAGVQRAGMGAVEISVADTGKALLILGCSMLISLITAVAGAMAGARKPEPPSADAVRFRATTEPGFAPPAEPTTMAPPYPTPTTGPATPVIPDSSLPR